MIEATPKQMERTLRDLGRGHAGPLHLEHEQRHEAQALYPDGPEGDVSTAVWKGRVRLGVPAELTELIMEPDVARRLGQRLISLARRAKRSRGGPWRG